MRFTLTPWRKKKTPPPPIDFTPYQGNWVAVKGGVLVAVAKTAQELMDVLTSSDGFRGSTAWFEEYPEKVMRWSVQYASNPGKVCPNCLFMTREAAEGWLLSWSGNSPGDEGAIYTRAGQHEPWVLAETGA